MEPNYEQLYQMEQIKKNEKKVLKKSFALVALTLIIYLVFSAVISLPLVFINNILPSFILENETLYSAIYYSLYLIITFLTGLVPAFFLRKMDKKPMGLYPVVDNIEPQKALRYVCGGFMASFVANLAANVFVSVFGSFGAELTQPDFSLPENPVGMFLYFIIITLGAGIGEEILFRGALLGCLRKYGDVSAIIISAFLFGAIHGNLIQMPFAFVLGLYLGYVAVKTRNLVYPMLVHAVNNGVATIVNYLSEGSGEIGAMIVGVFYTLVTIGLGVLGLVLLIIKRDDGYKLRKEQGVFTAGKKFSIMILTPLMIVLLVIVVISMIPYIKLTGAIL